MKSTLRKLGVENPDRYWREREAAGRVSEKRIHREIKGLFPGGGNVLDCGVGERHVLHLFGKFAPISRVLSVFSSSWRAVPDWNSSLPRAGSSSKSG